MGQEKISVLIVDDHELTRIGIRQVIEQASDMEVVGEAGDGDEGIALVERLCPRVLLLDIQMPGTPASEIARWVRKHNPAVITLVLTAHDRDAYLAEFIKSGVTGYLDKNRTGNGLAEAIRRATQGECLFTSSQRRRAKEWNTQVGQKWESLTQREKQVARLLTAGQGDKEISAQLNISRRTVSCHAAQIQEKLGVKSRQKIITWMIKSGLEKE